MATLPTASPTGSRRSAPRRWINLAASLLALFLIIVGARLWLVRTYMTPLGYSDPWDGEAAFVLKPWIEGHYHFRSLLDPHNEHRVLPTRLLCLAIFAVNGQWDAQLEAAVNAALWAGFAVVMAGVLIQTHGVGWRWAILAALAVYGALPFGWENTLNGFASQYYFLIGFSLLAIWGMGLHRAATAAWWAGLGGALLASVSMGSGFLASAVVLGLLAVRVVDERALPGWGGWLTAAISAGIVATGWLTRTIVPAHAVLKTTSPAAWAQSFCLYLAWPCCAHPAFALLIATPWLLLAAVHLHRLVAAREQPDGGGRKERELLLAVGAWGLLQVAAITYARDAHGTPPSPRYMDVLAIFPLINFLAAAWLASQFTFPRWSRVLAGAVATLWLGTLALGLWQETKSDFQGWLPAYADAQQRSQANVFGYVNTGDAERYLAEKSFPDIPYPSAARLKALLDDSTIREFLPANVRAPLRLQVEDPPENSPFVPNGFPPADPPPPPIPGWGSYPDRQGTTRGFFPPETGPDSGLPYLQFQFSGDLGEPGVSFILRDAASRHQVDWHPRHVPHGYWRVDYIQRPGHDLQLEASATDARKWFAFTAPVEVGGWSYWTGYVLRRARIVLAAGAALALCALANDQWRLRRTR